MNDDKWIMTKKLQRKKMDEASKPIPPTDKSMLPRKRERNRIKKYLSRWEKKKRKK